MPNIPETLGHSLTRSAAPDQSLRDSAIDQLKDFERRINDDGCPAGRVIEDFVLNFDSTELLGPVLRGLSEEKKENILRAAARCHVASFGRGRQFLAKRDQLYLVDQDSSALFGALPTELRAAMIADAFIDECGQIVFPFPDIGLCIPLGRTSLGTGEGALTTHEIQRLLTYVEERRSHCRLEIFSAKLVHFGALTPDTETCHIWSDLIHRCIDRKPIAEFSEEQTVLEALASTLMTLTDRISARGCDAEFSMVRMLTNSAEAYFLAGDHWACGTTLLELAASHTRKLEYDAAVGAATLAASAAKLAASVLARNALKRWEDGRYADAVVNYEMAMSAYAREEVLRGIRSVPPASTSGAVDEIVPLPKFVEPISQPDFKAAWADRRSKTEEMLSQTALNLRALGIMRELAESRAQQSGRGTSN